MLFAILLFLFTLPMNLPPMPEPEPIVTPMPIVTPEPVFVFPDPTPGPVHLFPDKPPLKIFIPVVAKYQVYSEALWCKYLPNGFKECTDAILNPRP